MCDQFQRMGKPTPKDEMPLQPQVALEPFDKWGMDFIGPIDSPSGQKKYIIVCNYYLTKWVETKAVKVATKEKVVEFLRENVFYKFGYPKELVTDQGAQFTSYLIENLLRQNKIKHRKSTTYHPRANGQVKVTNRALEDSFTKIVSRSRKYWVEGVVEAPWANNTTQKTTTGFTPYDLVYGKKVLLSIEFEYNTLRMEAKLDLDVTKSQQERLLQLNGLDEFRMQTLLNTEVIQVQRKVWHDKNIKDKVFQEGDWALLYDSKFKDFKRKMMTKWLGPYLIEKCHDNGVVQIKTINEEGIPFLVNGYRLKAYNRPMSMEEFISTISKEVNLIRSVLASRSPNS